MGERRAHNNTLPELDDDDKAHIMDLFFEDTTKKLRKLHARTGIINCSFAGERYRNWNILFRSAGSDFEIVDFEYDEDTVEMDLDL